MMYASTHARSHRPRLLLIALLLALATCLGSPAGGTTARAALRPLGPEAAPALGRTAPAPATSVSRGVAVALSNGADSFTDAGTRISDWCLDNGATIGTADFNADLRDDLWCHDTFGTTWVALNTGSQFTDMGIRLSNWCSGASATFGAADFTGDGKDELWCHDTIGNTSVALNTGSALVDVGIRLSNWCVGTNVKFGSGHFRVGPLDSLWCYDNGTIRIALSNGVDALINAGIWLGDFCTQSEATFGVGDVGKFNVALDDMWCYDPATGTVSVAEPFIDRDLFEGPYDYVSGICMNSGYTIGVGRFKQTGGDGGDIWCRDYAGTVQVATMNPQGNWQLHIVLGYWCPPGATIGVADFIDTNGTNPTPNSDLWCHSKT